MQGCCNEPYLFVDDTSLFATSASSLELCKQLQQGTDDICRLFSKRLLTVNPTKSAVIVMQNTSHENVILQVIGHPHFGVLLNETLSWSCHVAVITLKASSKTRFLQKLCSMVGQTTIKLRQHRLVRSSKKRPSIVGTV